MANFAPMLISILRTLVEVGLLSLIGQGAVAILSGSRREANPIYQLFRIVTRPVLRIVRLVTPRRVIDRHLPIVAFFLLFWLWIFLAYLKRIVAAG